MIVEPIADFVNIVSGVVSGIDNTISWVANTINSIKDIFADIDFTILYSWLPSDISGVITACIALLLALAIFGILKRVLFFLG